MPIFYDVEPSDVKLETEVYRDALTQHKKERGAETVQGWEQALKEVTKIKGWDTKNTGHGELAQLIARKVLVKLKVSCVHISDHLVGIDKSVNEVVDLLNIESEDIRLIGIWGMGGIGKTTLAKVVYHNLSTNFESCSFISNIREASKDSGLLNVQRQLVSNIIGDVGVELSSIDHGMNMIRDRFNKKKVLIFLDDVDHRRQLTALAAKEAWFGPGSRVVITTRDKSVLSGFQDQFEHCLIYEAKGLDNPEALQLFSDHAFRSNSPPDAFTSLSEKVTAKTGGLPLAVEVIGSFLHGKREVVWQATLTKMEHCQHKDVKEKLMLSYEALDHHQQQIFLDIACFEEACFVGRQTKSEEEYMWEDSGFFPDEGIEVLLLTSLVKIGEDNKLWMHDQLKDLGRSIVYEANCKDPGKGSRVWKQNDPDSFGNRKGAETVLASYSNSLLISKDFCGNFRARPQDFVLTSEDFVKMPNIRLLHMFGGYLSGDFEGLFSELRWLRWPCCPQDMQATNFCPRNLVILVMHRSRIDEHWGGWTQLKVATKLKVLDLSSSDVLKEIPDLSSYLSLEILALSWCRSLLRIDPSIGLLKGLLELDVSYTGIAELPTTILHLKSLKVLKIDGTHLQKLPESIGTLEKLEEIHGEGCREIEMIPSDIVTLPFLKILKLTETKVRNVPKLPQSLVILYMSSSATNKAPDISNLVKLRNLELCFPSSLHGGWYGVYSPRCMLELPSITSVSSYLGCLSYLRELELRGCHNLRQIGQLPSTLRKLTICYCDSLEAVDLSNLGNLLDLKLEGGISDIQGLEGLTSLQFLELLYLESSAFSGIETLENLRLLVIYECPHLQTLPNLSNLKNLKDILLLDCPGLIGIQGLDKLESLQGRLTFKGCSSLRSLPDPPNSKYLVERNLDIYFDAFAPRRKTGLEEMISHFST